MNFSDICKYNPIITYLIKYNTKITWIQLAIYFSLQEKVKLIISFKINVACSFILVKTHTYFVLVKCGLETVRPLKLDILSILIHLPGSGNGIDCTATHKLLVHLFCRVFVYILLCVWLWAGGGLENK